MFCPSCGTEERHRSQFCRVCGTDLRVVRTGLERPDAITESAVTAREEIGRAIATKIRDVQSGQDLKHIGNYVLPQLSGFLESPEEKRLKLIRAGIILTSVGAAASLLFVVLRLFVDLSAAINGGLFLALSASGLVPLLLGLGLVINGLYFTLPQKKSITPAEDESNQKEVRTPSSPRKELTTAQPLAVPSSVTEHTTYNLPG
jgi:hypothetical protein